MKVSWVLRIGMITLIAVLGGRALYRQAEFWQHQRLTSELCSLVGNSLETSAVRTAYEGIQQGLARSAFPEACIDVMDQGQHYSNDCLNADKNYQLTLCTAEGNRGSRVEIHYPVVPFVTPRLCALWISVWVTALLVLVSIRSGLTYFSLRITEELRNRLFGASPEPKKDSTISRLANWLAQESGVLGGVRTQAEEFESQIREYEGKIRTEAVLRAQKEVEAQKSKERLEEIKKIRHDLGSPLSSFLSVQEKIVGDDLSRQTLSSGIQKIQKMLDRLDDVEIDHAAPRLTIVEAVAVEAVALMRSKFYAAKRVSIRLTYDSSELSATNATPDGLTRVLNNLLENAFDASSAGGTIHLQVRSIESRIEISVEDSGCGISPEVVPHLFEKGATFGKVNGTGYGLHQSKQLIESWRGSIAFEPLSQGTRFIVSLVKLQAGTAFVGLPSTKRLWVIDDDRSVAETLDRIGYEVVESALTYDEGEVLLKKPVPENVAVIFDFRLDNGRKGTDLAAGHLSVAQMYLCTNDFDSPEVIKIARQIGVRIIPKPLCFLVETNLKGPNSDA